MSDTWIKTDQFHARWSMVNRAVFRADFFEVDAWDGEDRTPILGEKACASLDVKWDGCSNLTTSPDGCMWHGCTRAQFDAFLAILGLAFDTGIQQFTEQGNWEGF